MFAKFSTIFAFPPILALALSGCASPSDQVKAGYYNGDETISYGQAFAVAFEDGVWSDAKDDKGQKVAQFTGKISPGLHRFVRGKREKSDDRIIFSASLNYLGSLIKKGKVEGQPDLTFNIRDYPISTQGNLFFDSLADYASSPDNLPKIQRLNAFYLERYWAEGSECTFQWNIYARGKMSRVVHMSNRHWDDDAMFAGKPEEVLREIFEYAKSAPR